MIERLTSADCYDLWSNNASFAGEIAPARMAQVIEGFLRANGMVDVAADLLGAMGVGYRGGAHLVSAFAREMGFKVTSNKAQTMFRFSTLPAVHA